MDRPADSGLRTQSYDGPGGFDRGSSVHAYLLVIDGASSRRHALPRDGTLVIGRSADADIFVDAVVVSRRHAQLVQTGGEIEIADLGSHNGTVVNGERIEGSRLLRAGDVITLGNATLVLQCEPRAAGRATLDASRLRQRLGEELARSLDYARPLAVAVVSLGGRPERAALAVKAASALRLMDVLGWDGETQLVALLPELGGEAARAAAEEIVEALAPLSADVRVGLAVYPTDGCDAETLLSAARAGSAIAAPGRIATPADTIVRHTIGDRTILAADPAMVRLFELIRRLAASELPVLVLGETGAGKENAAAAVHHWSARASKPLVTLNCAALPEALIESELFGYEKGAFSDARAPKPGLLERASGGTVFLDEVGELAASAQAKLLRAIEQKRITRLGDVREREVDIRVVAATHRDLRADSRAGRFRQDLFFRLSAAVVELPPLRHRPREVPILARLFATEACARARRPELPLSEATLQTLAAYAWPGNVRELKNALDFAVATAEGDAIEPWNLPDVVAASAPTALPATEAAEAAQLLERGAAPPSPAPRRFRPIAEELRELERTRMLEALEATSGVQTRAAALIGMPARTFTFKLKQYAISPRDAKPRSDG